MARLFDDAASEYLQYGGAVVSAVPFVLACWFRSDSVTVNQTLLSIADTAGDSHFFRMAAMGAVAGDPIRAQCSSASGSVQADTSSGFSANTWHHACAAFATATDRRVYLDGGSKGTDANNRTPAGLDTTAIGTLRRNSISQYMSGRIAWAAIWDLTNWPGATGTDKADGFEARALPGLADGYSPLFWPLGLTAFWPLGGLRLNNSGNAANSDWDVVGGYHMDPQNTPSVADHPGGLIYPSVPQVVMPTAAGQTVTPAAVSASWSAVAPTLKKTIVPSSVSATWSAVYPGLAKRLTPTPPVATWSAITPSTGGVTVYPSPASAAWAAVAPSLFSRRLVVPTRGYVQPAYLADAVYAQPTYAADDVHQTPTYASDEVSQQ
jgi:hypothetical protein